MFIQSSYIYHWLENLIVPAFATMSLLKLETVFLLVIMGYYAYGKINSTDYIIILFLGVTIDDRCLSCICKVESNCRAVGCNMDAGSLSCGYFQIKKPYYIVMPSVLFLTNRPL